MLYSMTGYGKGSGQNGNIVAEAELKSVNSRFLDISVRIPRILATKEFEIRNLIKSKIKRGKINLFLQISKAGVNEDAATLSKDGLQSTLNLINEIKSTAGIKDNISLDNILSFQNIYLNQDQTNGHEEYAAAVDAINIAVDDLLKMRAEEAAELAADLKNRISIISSTVDKVEEYSRKSVSDYFEKLKERAAQLTKNIVEYDDRLNIELALLAEKYDVTEEFIRLKSHIKLFLETLDNTDEAGRKLNFITQEMNREVNTINSKTVSTEIAHHGISMKEEIEKIREQIQNIE